MSDTVADILITPKEKGKTHFQMLDAYKKSRSNKKSYDFGSNPI